MVVTKEHPSFMRHTRKQKIRTKGKREVRGWADNSQISFKNQQIARIHPDKQKGQCAMIVSPYEG